MAGVWLEYGYSMAKAWDKEHTVFSRLSLAFGNWRNKKWPTAGMGTGQLAE